MDPIIFLLVAAGFSLRKEKEKTQPKGRGYQAVNIFSSLL
jgi:hypothetical protein